MQKINILAPIFQELVIQSIFLPPTNTTAQISCFGFLTFHSAKKGKMSEALKLLQNNGDRKASFLSNIWAPLSCSIFGFGAMCFVNFGTRRPILSGTQNKLYNFTVESLH